MKFYDKTDPVTFMLQNNMPESSTRRMIVPVLDYARANSYDIVDRSLTNEFDPDNLDVDNFSRHIVYGSVGWAFAFRNSRYFRKRIFYNEENFSATSWHKHLGNHWLNHDGQYTLAWRVEDWIKHFGGQAHLRPNVGDKKIIGGVFDLERWTQHKAERNIDVNLPVWISPLHQIDAEYRCFIVRGKCIEISQYRKDGVFETQRITDPGLFAVADAMVLQNKPVSTFVLDFCSTPNGYKLVEYNPIHGSGWYAVDVAHVLDEWIDSTGIF